MSYLGDFALNATFDFKFNTHKADGTPITLAGTPVISVYKDNSTTQTTTGPTLTVDFDSLTGLHNVRMVCTDAFYATACCYQAVITTGTVDSISVVGTVVAEWSIEKRSALRPTTAGTTLDISATGEAGLDFNNIKAATGATTLTNIVVPTVTDITNAVKISAGTGAGQIDFTSGVVKSNCVQILGTAVSAPATAGILDVNLKNIANAAVSTTTAQLGVNAVQISGDATAADNCEADYDGTGYAGGTIVKTADVTKIAGAAVSTTTAQLGVNVVQISGDATAADNCEADYDGTGYAGGTIVKTADVTKLLGTAWLAPGVAGTPDVNVKLISADSVAADNLESFCDGTGYAGTNNVIPTVTASGLSAAAIDAIWDEVLSGHVGATTVGKAITDILAFGAPPTAAANADQIWDEVLSGHVGATTTGKALTDVLAFGAPPTAAVITAAVLDHALADHLTAGTVGNFIAQTGADIDVDGNELILTIGATEIKRFELKDAAGNPTMTDVYTRITHA